jgi:hypothetical protein
LVKKRDYRSIISFVALNYKRLILNIKFSGNASSNGEMLMRGEGGASFDNNEKCIPSIPNGSILIGPTLLPTTSYRWGELQNEKSPFSLINRLLLWEDCPCRLEKAKRGVTAG